MIDIKLVRLELKNFKGIKNFVFEPGQDSQVYGDNATGKTTVFDAWLWLLFGKDSANKADFNIKTLDKTGEPEHGIDHSVEALITVDGPDVVSEVTLKKVYKEKWTKKRGSATPEFTGHTTDHFIDEVPTSKTDYEYKIAEMINQAKAEQVFRLITDVNHFNVNLNWQDRRKLLIEVSGDVDIEDIYAANPELEKLRDGIGNNTVEDYRKIAKGKLTTLNKELKDIPPRIDELTRTLPILESDDSASTILERVEAERAKISELQATRERILNGGERAKIKAQIMELQAQAVRGHAEGDQKKAAKKRELLDTQAMLTRQLDTLEFEKGNTTKDIERLALLVNELRKQWDERSAATFEMDVDLECPICGQDMPVDKIADIMAKAEADFNVQKAKELEGINKEGKAAKKAVAKLEANYVTLTDKIETLLDKRFKVDQQIESLGADKDSETVEPKLAEEIEELKSIVEQLAKDQQGELDKTNQNIEHHEKLLEEFEGVLRDIKAAESTRERIEELKNKERMIAREYERWQEQVHLTELFIKTHVEMLDSKINSKFELARFKLFNVQINEGIEETCETMFNGVPYGDLNHGMRVNIGLDIIKTLIAHFGLSAPVFVDNAESITKLIDMQCQVIQLIVSKKDKKLRVASPKEV